ncbi:H-type lectin domain-containing protein [Aestuariibius sp. HNIBRBA575]|uniref:H-type lectin domain-containing protein n=1 Tax=Aestuariibius sp. HNIBRBA575 TaxID=3233343 RepID=UPI0034A5CE16
MKRLRNHWIGIDQGEVVLFSDFQNDGEMWSGEGPRQMVSHVSFGESYRTPPTVQAHLSMWDISNGANGRMDVQTDDVTVDGFKIVFRTWGDTKVARVRVGWQAIGELRHADEWDLY